MTAGIPLTNIGIRPAKRARGRRRVEPIVLTFPLPRTHCGFALGNGRFGALVWGAERLCITINRADFWDHREGQTLRGEGIYEKVKACFNPHDARSADAPFEAEAEPWTGGFRNTRLPMGRFEFDLAAGLTLTEGTLDAERGELAIALQDASRGDVRHVVIALHPNDDALLVHDPSHALQNARAKPAWDWVQDAMRDRGYAPPRVVEAEGACGWTQACPDDPAAAAWCTRRGNDAVIAMQRGDTAEDEAQRLANRWLDAGHEAFFGDVRAWWRDYWRDVPRVRLPDRFFDDFLRLALYKFGAATNPQSATPCALQGPWCEEHRLPPWSGDYHFNVNVQQIYTLAFAAGKSDHLLPLFDMIERCMPIFQRNAQRMVGIDDGLLITHTTDDRGYACGGVGPGAAIDQAVSGWVAQLYWLYYRHTGDLAFLRGRAMPFMAAVMRTFAAMLEWRDGQPALPASISAEYGKPLPDGSRQRVGADPSSQWACMHMLLNALIEGSQQLGEEPQPAWLTLRDALPPWTLIGAPGDERIAVWRDTDLDISHRHHSHLSCIYPFDSLGPRTPQMQAIVQRSLRRWLEVGMSDWSEWCLPWAAIIEAREGYREGPYLLLKLCRELFINEGMATVYIPRKEGFTLHGLNWRTGPLETCEVMQLDGTMALATALYEMLVHRHGDEVRFFPAVPAAWNNVAFSDIRLPGPMRASGEIVDGRIRHISLTSECSQTVRLVVPGYDTMQLDCDGRHEQVALPLQLTLHPGQSVLGYPVR